MQRRQMGGGAETHPGQGGRLVRAAGTSAVYQSRTEDGFAVLKMPSKELRMVRAHAGGGGGGAAPPSTFGRVYCHRNGEAAFSSSICTTWTVLRKHGSDHLGLWHKCAPWASNGPDHLGLRALQHSFWTAALRLTREPRPLLPQRQVCVLQTPRVCAFVPSPG